MTNGGGHKIQAENVADAVETLVALASHHSGTLPGNILEAVSSRCSDADVAQAAALLRNLQVC